MGVGVFGMLASMGMLLYSLSVIKQDPRLQKPEPMSQVAFRSLLRQGEIVDCTVEGGRLVGRRRGMRPGSTSPFALNGPVSATVIRELERAKVPVFRKDATVPATTPADTAPPRPAPRPATPPTKAPGTAPTPPEAGASPRG